MCEDGATLAATYLLFGEIARAGLARAERAAILHGDLTLQESPIKYPKCPTNEQNAGDFLEFNWLALQNRWNNWN